MNERFLELAIKAREYAETKPDIYRVAYDKKFAELIVQECMLAVSKTPVSDDEVPIMVRCHDQIGKHFWS